MLLLQMTTSPEVLSQASRCPYIQKVVAETGDPQTVRIYVLLPQAGRCNSTTCFLVNTCPSPTCMFAFKCDVHPQLHR